MTTPPPESSASHAADRPPASARPAAVSSRVAAEPVGVYAHARRVGPLLFLAGLGPRVRGTRDIPGVVLDAQGRVADYDIESQVRACFENVRLVLTEAGSSWDRIIDVTVFLTDMQRDFPAVNRLWAEFFGPGVMPAPPTRTTVEIKSLPQAGNAPINFEVKVIATVD